MAILGIDKLLIDALENVFVNPSQIVIKKMRENALPRTAENAFSMRMANPVKEIVFNEIGELPSTKKFPFRTSCATWRRLSRVLPCESEANQVGNLQPWAQLAGKIYVQNLLSSGSL
jgi:hypothetical protein